MKPRDGIDKTQVEQRRKDKKERKKGRNDIGAAMERKKNRDYRRRKQHDHEQAVDDYEDF